MRENLRKFEQIPSMKRVQKTFCRSYRRIPFGKWEKETIDLHVSGWNMTWTSSNFAVNDMNHTWLSLKVTFLWSSVTTEIQWNFIAALLFWLGEVFNQSADYQVIWTVSNVPNVFDNCYYGINVCFSYWNAL